MDNPQLFKLPQRSIATEYIIAKNDYYFVFPTSQNTFIQQFNNTFQHGGISMQEMILPFIKLTSK